MNPEYTLAVGILGDGATFVGSVLLAWDALTPKKTRLEDEHVVSVRRALRKLQDIQTPDGEAVNSDEDIRRFFTSRRAWKAKIGAIFLVVGFGALLTLRLNEGRSHERHGQQI